MNECPAYDEDEQDDKDDKDDDGTATKFACKSDFPQQQEWW